MGKCLGQESVLITRVGQWHRDSFCLAILAQLSERGKLLFFDHQILNYSLGLKLVVSWIPQVRLHLPLSIYGTLWTQKCFWALVLAQGRRLLLFEIRVFSEQFVPCLVEVLLELLLRRLLWRTGQFVTRKGMRLCSKLNRLGNLMWHLSNTLWRGSSVSVSECTGDSCSLFLVPKLNGDRHGLLVAVLQCDLLEMTISTLEVAC